MTRESTILSSSETNQPFVVRVIDWFLSSEIKAGDSETLRRARIVSASTFTLSLVSFCYVPFYLWAGSVGSMINMAVAGVIGFAILGLLRRTGRHQLAGNLILADYVIAITISACFQGGAVGVKLIWFVPAPLLGIVITGRRWAVVWTVVSVALVATFYGLHMAGVRFPNDVAHIQNMIYTMHVVGLSVSLSTIGWFFDSLMGRMLSDLRNARDAAEAATRAKSEFLANMSHEIRTPMTAILGYSEQLLDDEVSAEEFDDASRTIQRNGRHLLQVLNDILDLSKIEAGKLKVERIRCRVSDILSDVYELMRTQAETKGLELRCEQATSLPETVCTDPTRLRQMLMNLVSNGIKFTRTGSIRMVVRSIHSAAAMPTIVFEVIDTGIGMTDEQMTHMFKPFQQADTSMTREFGGTGLGLAITRQVACIMGGEITVESEPGVGSVFKLSVPVYAPEGEVLAPAGHRMLLTNQPLIERRADASVKRVMGGRILLAEDGLDNQRLVSVILRKAGIDVTIVENGQEAVHAVSEAEHAGNPFNLVLMDMQMPVMDGYQATMQLRDQGSTIPVVALTAHAMAGDREKCLAAGCDGFATKPINREALLRTVKPYCSQPVVEGSADAIAAKHV